MSTPEAIPARLALLVCTWGGVGRLRPAPGTWGSVAAAAIAVAILLGLGSDTGRWVLLGGVAATTVLGVMLSPAACAALGLADPPDIVIDEVAGTWLAVACLPAAALASPWLSVAVALLAFRLFDIAKPWPVGWAEGLPRGWGIMADDLLAGLIAALLATLLLV
jgi:phosphatidylglycerophosphatase A